MCNKEHLKLISIITINYNDGVGLKNTIASVLPALASDVEYVVVDGGSTDCSQYVIKENIHHIDKLLSEPDSGIANAFNKGIELATGRFLIFINAGDILTDTAISSIKRVIKGDNECSLIYIGKIKLAYEERSIIAGARISKYRQSLRNYLPHQAMVFSARCFERYGVYDENYRLGMDYEWSLRVLPDWKYLLFHDHVISIMDTGGVSMTNYADTFKAYHLARKKHNVMPTSLSYFLTLFFIVKRTVGLMFK